MAPAMSGLHVNAQPLGKLAKITTDNKSTVLLFDEVDEVLMA